MSNAAVSLEELGLNSPGKNLFEIHEKEGPPKRLKIDSSTTGGDYSEEMTNLSMRSATQDYFNDESTTQTYPPSSHAASRRNACVNEGVYTTNPSECGSTSSYINCATSPTSSASNLNLNYGPANAPTGSGYYSSSSYENNQASSSDDESGYVGLINQAMTCYLNSLLQTLYMTPEFRNAIYRYIYIYTSTVLVYPFRNDLT